MYKKSIIKKLISVVVAGSFVLAFLPNKATAINPIVRDVYTADPAPFVAPDGRLYVYTSHDEDVIKNNFFTMDDWKCFSTDDMVNWTDHGTVLSWHEFSSWAKDNSSWAGQVTFRNGKYYYYVPINAKSGPTSIGVAVADSPIGPFKDPINKPLIGPAANYIDPTVFIDDDDQAYLYWGNPDLFCVLLNEDMISYDKNFRGVQGNGSVCNNGIIQWRLQTSYYSDLNSSEVKNLQKMFGTGTRMDGNKLRRPTQYEEGPWFYKRGDHYYLVFAANGIPERLDYSMADNPLGPWTYKGMIMNDNVNGNGTGSFTNHPGVVDYKGHSYLFYHTGKLPNGGGYHRSVAVEEIKYNNDGTINRVDFTDKGVDAIQDLNPYKRVEAETVAYGEGIEKEDCSNGGQYGARNVCDISNNDYILVKNVGFSDNEAIKFEACVSSSKSESQSAGQIELHLDSRNGNNIGTVNVQGTNNSWKTTSIDVDHITGTHDLYFVFKGSGDNLFKFDYWKFTPEKLPVEPTAEPVATEEPSDPEATQKPSDPEATQKPSDPEATADPQKVGTNTDGDGTIKKEVIIIKNPDGSEESIVLGEGSIKSVKNIKKGTASIVIKKVKGVSGYQVKYALNKKFTKGRKLVYRNRIKAKIRKLKVGKKYYFAVRPYVFMNDTSRKYGEFGKVKKLVIKK